ncbi:MAG: hypothetical protein LBL76_06865 [Treponema sp.]|nr:hypothetical protein [Treponema sp.]
MDRSSSLYRTRLLNKKKGEMLVCLLLLVPYLGAQEAGEVLTVEWYSHPEVPQVHTSWVVGLLVDYPVSRDITVHRPPLPGTLTLESIRTRPRRTGTDPESGNIQTMVEFWFIPHKVGPLTLGSFEVITPDKRYVTEPRSWYIQGEEKREYQPVCSWVNPPQSLEIGERGIAALRLMDWDPQKPWPDAAFVLKELPEGALLEAEPLRGHDQEQGIVLRLGIIPLKGPEFTFKPMRILHEGFSLEIPEFRVQITPGVYPPFPKPKAADIPPLVAARPDTSNLPFPQAVPQVFPWFRVDYEQALYPIQNLWNQGKIPEALGAMRRNERENLAGPCFALLRREAEQTLGLPLTQDEPWRPLKLYRLLLTVSLGVLLFALIAVLLRLGRRKHGFVTSPTFQGYKGIKILLILGVGLLMFAMNGLGIFQPGKAAGQGVLRTALAYRVPEDGGGVSASFSEGQPVQIRAVSDYWVYVESFDGRLGWVARDKLIWY